MNRYIFIFHIFLATLFAEEKENREPADIFMIQSELQKDPHNVVLLYKLGRLYIDAGELKKAKEVLKKAEASDPNNQDVQLMLGYVYFGEGDFIEAKQKVDWVLESDPNSVIALILGGRIALLENNELQASEYFEKALKLDPQGEEVKTALSQLRERDTYVLLRELKEKAEAAKERGDKKKAIQNYERLTEEFPENYDYQYELGELYKQNGQYKEARGAFQKALKLSPGNMDVEFQLASIDYYEKNYDKAQERLKIILKDNPESVDSLFLMGLIFAKNNDKVKALEYLIRAQKIDPNRNDIQLAIARLESGPGTISEELQMARELELDSEFDQAEKIYLRLLKKHPNSLDIQYRLGRLYVWMERFRESAYYLEKVLKEDPNNSDARISYGYLLYREKKYDRAEQEIEKTLKNDPENIGALVAGGLIAFAENNQDLAKKRFKLVLKQDPNMSEALIGLGRIAEHRKEFHKAYNYFENAYNQNKYNYAAFSGLSIIRPFVNPTLFIKGSYSQERESDLVLKIRTTQTNTTYGSMGLLIPISDHLRLFNTFDYVGTEQYNLIRKIDNYMVNSFYWNFGAETFFKRYWSIRGQNSVKWSWDSAKTIFLFERKTSWEPLLSLRYNYHPFFVSGTVSLDSFIARNFDTSRAFMIERKNLILASAWRYYPSFGDLGFIAKNINYTDSFNNHLKDFETWIQSPALEYFGNWYLRYAWHWGSFKEVNPEYYSYRYKVRHKIRGTYLLMRDPWTQIEISYMWTWAKERDFTNESNIVIVPQITQPQILKKNIYDAHTIEVFFRKNFETHFWIELMTRYYTDSNKYQAWLGKAELRYIF